MKPCATILLASNQLAALEQGTDTALYVQCLAPYSREELSACLRHLRMLGVIQEVRTLGDCIHCIASWYLI